MTVDAGNQRVVAGAVAVAIAAAIAWAGTTAIRGEQQVPIQPGPSLLTTYRLLNVSDGSEAPFPAPEGGSWFWFSPDGWDVIFVKDDTEGHPQLFRMRADGSDVGQITPDPEWALEADEPTLSPGGEWIAYRGVTRERAAGDHRYATQRLSPSASLGELGKRDARTPSWSLRGGKIAFVARGIWVLLIQHYNRGESITSGPPGLILSAGTSPAGRLPEIRSPSPRARAQEGGWRSRTRTARTCVRSRPRRATTRPGHRMGGRSRTTCRAPMVMSPFGSLISELGNAAAAEHTSSILEGRGDLLVSTYPGDS